MPPLLLVKLLATPLLVGGASLASRRWGPAVGGWIVSLPLTSGPVLFFLALEQGPAFAAATTTGTLLGMGAISGYSLGYVLASRGGPVGAIAGASAAYALAAVAVQPVTGWPLPVLVAGVLAAITVVLWRMPASSGTPAAADHPRWDLPARIAVGTTLVVLFTAVAPTLGPVWSGLVTTFPAYVSVLAVFEHLHRGRPGALDVLRGLLTGLYGTVTFFVVLRLALEPGGVAVAFPLAIVVAGIVGMVALRVVRRGSAAAAPLPEPETV